MRKRLAQAGLALLIASLSAAPAAAQGLGGPARAVQVDPALAGARSRPPLSPYLDLLRRDSGVLPPYHAFVVPRRRFQQQQVNQWRAIGQLRRDQQALHAEAVGSRAHLEPLPTGRGGRFQSYLHFYPLGDAR